MLLYRKLLLMTLGTTYVYKMQHLEVGGAVRHIYMYVIRRLKVNEELEPKMRPEQAGFRPNKTCAGHINTLRITVEQSVEFRSLLQLVFIDFQQAFDTLAHNAIWQALKEKGVPEKIVTIVKALYDQSTCDVLYKNQISEPIPVLESKRVVFFHPRCLTSL